MQFYNTLTRKTADFTPLKDNVVTIYTCGPTVYNQQHIGNYRTLLFYDLLARSMKYLGYKVKHVMNYTDVGHLTMTDLERAEAEKKHGKLEDADSEKGVDKLEKQAKKEGLTPIQIADKYIKLCETDLEKLNFHFPEIICRATDYIPQQIEMIQELEKKGYTYVTPEAVYFNVDKYNTEFENSYFQLSGEQSGEQLTAVREAVAEDKTKHHPADFRLWQLNQPEHSMQWESPWGRGYPGWHIECSAMARTHLGDRIDIHVGGSNLIFPHHTNEIAQSQGATGKKPFAQVWIHTGNLEVYGKKMGKSLGNAFTLQDVEEKGFNPIVLRYLYLQTHYRQPMNFTWEALTAAQEALKKLTSFIQDTIDTHDTVSEDKVEPYKKKFSTFLAHDLEFPQALALIWEMMKSDLNDNEKRSLILEFDTVFGLGFKEVQKEEIPAEITQLAEARQQARASKDFAKSDELRKKIEEKGWTVEDTKEGYKIKKV